MSLDFSEIYGTFKSRVRNPYFGSFLFSWIVINWEIPVGLSTLTRADLTALGYTNWLQYVECKINWWNGIAAPALGGIVIASITPFIIAGYKILKAKSEDWYTRDQKKNPEKRHISMEKYLELWETYGKRLDQLKKAIDEAEVFEKDRQELEEKIQKQDEKIKNVEIANNTLRSQQSKRDSEIEQLKTEILNSNDPKQYPGWLNGKALMRISSAIGNEEIWVKIESGSIYRINDKGELIPFLVILYTRNIAPENRTILSLVDVSAGSKGVFGIADIIKNQRGPKGATGSFYGINGTGGIEFLQEWNN